MADRNTSIDRKQLKPIQYDDLDATNSAVDNYVPSYDLATGKFTWIAVPDLSTSIDDFTIKYVNNKLKVADRIEYNIMLLAFYRAVDNSKSIYNLLDGFIDEYEDETGIDTGASQNEDYDSTNDLYKPTGGGVGIDEYTMLMLHLNNNVTDDGNGSVTGGHVVTNNNVTFSDSIKKWGYSGLFNGTNAYLSVLDSDDWSFGVGNFTIDLWIRFNDLTIGQRIIGQYVLGDYAWHLLKMPSANGNKIEFVWANIVSASMTNAWAGCAIDTWYHLELARNGTTALIFINGVSQALTPGGTGDFGTKDLGNVSAPLTIGYHAGSAGAKVDGYIEELRISKGICRHPENFTPSTSEYSSPTMDNMTLISNSQTADASPSDARIVIFEEDVDSITLNTDIKAYITRENGTGATWEQITLSDEGNYEGNKRVLAGVVDLDVTGMGVGTDVAYKITTHNEKDLKIHGTGVNWD